MFSLFKGNNGWTDLFPHPERIRSAKLDHAVEWNRVMRKLISFKDETLDKLTQLSRDRMATIQELADEAFADLLKKHGVPIDLKDALRKSVKDAGQTTSPRPTAARASNPSPARKRLHGKRDAKRSIRRG